MLQRARSALGCVGRSSPAHAVAVDAKPKKIKAELRVHTVNRLQRLFSELAQA